jgi:hypothetical protein
MSPHYYVKIASYSCTLKVMSGKKKKCRPLSTYPVPAIHCTGKYYAIPIPLSSRGVSQYLNRYNKYIFEKTVSGLDLWYEFQMCHKKGEGADSSYTRYKLVCFALFIKNTLAFEGGWEPCSGKTVSTRAHILEVQCYLWKTVKRIFKPNYNLKITAFEPSLSPRRGPLSKKRFFTCI